MTGRRRSPLPLLLALTVASVALSALPASAPASAGHAARSVDVLAFEPVSSPVFRALRHRLGRRIDVRRATRTRLRHPRRFEALIVDGDSSTPRELGRRAGHLRRFLDAGASVVAFDVGSAHHRRALYDLTGLKARPTRGMHSSRVALYRRVVSGGVPRMSIIDARRILPLGGARLGARKRTLAKRQQARRLAGMIGGELLAPKHPLAEAADALPPEVQHTSVSVTFPGSAVMPHPALAGNGGQCTCPNYPHPTYAPRVSPQTASWAMTHTVDAYLDNATDPGGDFQVVSYSVDGQLNPTGSGKNFAVMDGKFQWPGVFAPQNFNVERAWWTGFADVSVAPDAATGGKLSLESHSPTGELSTSYPAGEAFALGYRLSRPVGGGDASSTAVGRAQDHSIPDWAVLDQTAAKAPTWEFSARNNCDVRPAGYTDGGCFDMNAAGAKTPNRPNNLSLSPLEVHGSSRWQTAKLLGDSGSGTLTFGTSFAPVMADIYCTSWGIAACSGYELTRFPDPGCTWCNPQPGPDTRTLTVDVSAVIPVGIKDLTFDDPKPNGSSQEHVKATVTLKQPSKLSGGTNVVIYSNSRNAVVGPLIGNGPQSRTTVVVPKDQTSATFDIATNANGIPSGGSTSARISAFYAQATTAPLTVRSAGP